MSDNEQPNTVRRATVEVVTHCWNYSRLLTYQLSGFLLHPPANVNLRVSVCLCLADVPTCEALRELRLASQAANVEIVPIILDRTQLMRRAIGRNLACKATRADVVILTDCDYVYRAGAIDDIAAAMLTAPDPVMGYVRNHMASLTHDDGDAEISACVSPSMLDVDETRYGESRLRTAIGGSQIVTGEWARAHGYLPDSKRWQRGADKWQRTFEDKVFRRASGLELLPIDCPSVYRIRHSKRGRFDVGVKL